MNVSKFHLCEACCEDKYLKSLVKNTAVIASLCTICLEEKLGLTVFYNDLLKAFSRFLIRYHFAEHTYNSHWGGENLPSLFYEKNPIISNNFVNKQGREEEIEDFLYELFDLYNYESRVELFYGCDESGSRGVFFEPLKNEKSKIWEQYKKLLASNNYFNFEENAREKFKQFFEHLKWEMYPSPAEKFYRARIGYNESIQVIGIDEAKIKVPFKENEISAPPTSISKEGRANRKGISFLYLSSTMETAISEIRPHPGHYVSTGEFKCIDKIIVADLRFVPLYQYFQNEKEFEIFKFLRDLELELSKPITPEESSDYLVTQFISDILRQIGFDGILFNSSLSTGINLVAFEPKSFTYLPNSQKLFLVNKVNVEYKRVVYENDGILDVLWERHF